MVVGEMSYPRRAKEGEECGWDSEVSEDESVARRSAEIRHGIRERLSVHASATDALCNRHMRVREGAIAGGDARIARTYVCEGDFCWMFIATIRGHAASS